MKKIDSLNQVAEFHRTFNAPILETPQIPSKERCELRVSLLQEELNELKQAIEDNDLVEIADALCDLQYVLSGAVLEFGLGEKFVELF
ncbi:MAG: nucleoside triphosphate pyrophosphohydrolase family protein, partial [Cloacibacterium sp.]|nr:nucleoside triphosphate pyrophosphohydrolase family protein [Cloacibacterium sp.]